MFQHPTSSRLDNIGSVVQLLDPRPGTFKYFIYVYVFFFALNFFIPKRFHKDSTHAQTKRNDFPVGWSKLSPKTSDILSICVS